MGFLSRVFKAFLDEQPSQNTSECNEGNHQELITKQLELKRQLRQQQDLFDSTRSLAKRESEFLLTDLDALHREYKSSMTLASRRRYTRAEKEYDDFVSKVNVQLEEINRRCQDLEQQLLATGWIPDPVPQKEFVDYRVAGTLFVEGRLAGFMKTKTVKLPVGLSQEQAILELEKIIAHQNGCDVEDVEFQPSTLEILGS